MKRLLSGVILALIVLNMLILAFKIQPTRSLPATITVPNDYPTIQSAVDAASPTDTIYVKAGTYYENLVVNKTLSLVGENAANTIIDGANYSRGTEVVHIDASWVNLTRFTIRNSADHRYDGVHLDDARNCHISGNNITNNGVGVDLSPSTVNYDSSSNSIAENNITNNYWFGIALGNGIGPADNNSLVGNNITNNLEGIHLWYSWDNSIDGNNITNNGDGVFLYHSSNNNITGNNISNNGDGVVVDIFEVNNRVVGNNITANGGDGVFVGAQCSSNVFYHNNFIGNANQVSISIDPQLNIWWENDWDDGYPSGGNYWGGYNGTDLFRGFYQNETGADKIGDTPYVIEPNNTDRYPLMTTWAELLGDLNQDRVVDIYDAIILARAFGSTPSSSNWNHNADLNKDGIVDILDAIILAGNFRKTA